MLPQFKPVMALVIISGVAFGGETGFLAGVLFRKGLLRRSRESLAAFGAFSAVILIAAEPMLEKLDRIKVKYGLVE